MGSGVSRVRSSRKHTSLRMEFADLMIVEMRVLSVTLGFEISVPSMSSSFGNDSRRYGFSCTVCRRKKVRCDGARPVCRNCLKSGIECVYKPESGDLRLLQQVQRANRRVLELEEQVKKLASSEGKGATNLSESGTSPTSHLSSSNSTETILAKDAQSDDEDVREHAFAKLAVDENGEVPDPSSNVTCNPYFADLCRCSILGQHLDFTLRLGNASNCNVRTC